MPTRPPLESFMKPAGGGERPPLSSFFITAKPEAPVEQAPKEGMLKKTGKALIQSERGFGESIAGAIAPQTKEFEGAQEGQRLLFDRAEAVAKLIKEKKSRGEDT